MANKCTVVVEKIRSYQTLMYKNGFKTFPTSAYKSYKKELHKGMCFLDSMDHNVPLKLTLTFNASSSYEKEKHRIKLKSTNNTSKVFDNKEDAMAYLDESKHYYEYVPSEIKYGALPDVDNASKPVIDYLEEIGIISNDRCVVEFVVYKTFNNEFESIDIELEELHEINNDNVSFI